jgi:hypothetical protein
MKKLAEANARAEMAEFERVHTKPPTPDETLEIPHAVN